MTAADVLVAAHEAGLRLGVDGDRLTVSGPRSAVDRMRGQLLEWKSDVLALLRESEGGSATDAVLAAQSLIRQCRWPNSPSPCSFFIGHANAAKCSRCGGPFKAHADA